MFAALTPHRQPSPKNGLRHFSALPTHHPESEQGNEVLQFFYYLCVLLFIDEVLLKMEIISTYTDTYFQDSYAIGNKAYNLCLLHSYGFNVPPFIILTSSAFEEFLSFNSIQAEVKENLEKLNPNNYSEISQKLQSIVIDSVIPNSIIERINKLVAELGFNSVAIRSSGLTEDSKKASMAGMHSSYLYIDVNDIEFTNRIKECWASIFNKRAILYRMANNLLSNFGMAVIIQKMIKSEYSGVVFTKHPIDNDKILLEYTKGNCDELVNGKITPFSLSFYRNTNFISGNLNEVPLNVFSEVIAESIKIENFMKTPQDIEWCVDQELKLWILQTRSISVNNTFKSIF